MNTNNSSIPIAIAEGEKWVAVAAGSSHTVGIKADGSMWAWGSNFYGQIGWTTPNNPNIVSRPMAVYGDGTWRVYPR